MKNRYTVIHNITPFFGEYFEVVDNDESDQTFLRVVVSDTNETLMCTMADLLNRITEIEKKLLTQKE